MDPPQTFPSLKDTVLPFSRVFSTCAERWRRKDLPNAQMTTSGLLPPPSNRLAHSLELRSTLVPNAANHLVMLDLTTQLASRLALRDLSLSLGSVSLCVWSRADSVFELRAGDMSFSGDTICTDLSSMRFYTERPATFDVAHFIRISSQNVCFFISLVFQSGEGQRTLKHVHARLTTHP